MPAVNPEILSWARETAGLSIDDAVRKLGFGNTRRRSAAERLTAIESGAEIPSRSLIVTMSRVYRRPLVAFYLSAPPPRGDRGEDFRSLPQQHTREEPLVDVLVRDVRARQSMVRSILQDEEGAGAVRFIGSMTVDDGVDAVRESIQDTLGIDIETLRAQGTPSQAFALLRTRAESLGVFVLLIGNLGSHHTSLDTTAFRGFALADPIAPFVVINDQDAQSAWCFTLLHELAHLWIGATGISGSIAESRLERFCNDVASYFLLPENELVILEINRNSDRQTVMQRITEFARRRLLSRSLVAYRLFRANLISQGMWEDVTGEFRSEWRLTRAAQRGRDGEREGGPNYYVVRRHRLGSALLRFVARNLGEGNLTPTKASKVLGVKARSVEPLLRVPSVGRAA